MTTNRSANNTAGAGVLLPPLLWGGALTVGFYALIPYLPVQRELVQRYFCSHPLEYATATLFFVGMAMLVSKAMRLGAEKAALEHGLIDASPGPGPSDPLEQAERIEGTLANVSDRLRATRLGRRIADTIAFVRTRQSSEGIEEHLKYLAELAADRLHESYALLRTITWAVPILGFLGTVIGITMAIANVTPEQLDTSLGEVTGGLAVAFDTTALALALSLLLVFGTFLVERAEQRILVQVEDFGLKRLSALFPPAPEHRSPLVQAETQAAQLLLSRTEDLVERQTMLWQKSLEDLRTRWNQTLEERKQEFDAAFRSGTEAALSDHARQLAEIRGDFLEAFRNATTEMTTGMQESREASRQMHEEIAQGVAGLWERIDASLANHRDEQVARIEQVTGALADALGSWREQLDRHTEIASNQQEELQRQAELLLRIAGAEEELGRQETRLAESLDAVRAADSLQEVLHGLNAAVHLLTARASSKAA